MLIVIRDGLLVDPVDGEPLAYLVDAIRVGLAENRAGQYIIVNFSDQSHHDSSSVLFAKDAHQFALGLADAADLIDKMAAMLRLAEGTKVQSNLPSQDDEY